MAKKIQVRKLSLVPNVCDQNLREIYADEHASLAHVEMPADNISLLHNHHKFTEWYYILSGRGMIEAGDKKFNVRGGDVIILSPGEKHRLTNIGKGKLIHLVFSTPPFDPQDVNLLKE